MEYFGSFPTTTGYNYYLFDDKLSLRTEYNGYVFDQ